MLEIPFLMKASITIQPINPGRAMLSALGLGLIAATLESATAPHSIIAETSTESSLCCTESASIKP